jgi:hypothetical protein
VAGDIGGILREIEARLAGRFGVDARFQEPLAVAISTAVRDTVTASLMNCGEEIDIDTVGPGEYLFLELNVPSDCWAWAMETGSCRRTASPIHGIVIGWIRWKPRYGSIDASMVW